MIDSLDKYKDKYVFGFHDNINKSKGTKNCVAYANKCGYEVIIISH